MRKAIVAPVLAGVIALGAVAVAAIAAQAGTGPTSATFEVNGGALNISTPDSANLGTAAQRHFVGVHHRRGQPE